MGCCFSNDEDKRDQDEPTETSRLLANPVGNSSQQPYNDGYGGVRGANSHHKGDDQNALSRILHQTAANVIDVSALDTHLEQHEYLNRSRQYTQRVGTLGTEFALQKPCLLQDGAPQEWLSHPPLPPMQMQAMDELMDKVQQALGDIQVEHKEDLVVQFGLS
uniref:Ragulator complex protein LAMTOR1 n=1 Tax=Ornithodoros turicata TaxID=34597 RepID=A0A2R5LIG3_9ACAR